MQIIPIGMYLRSPNFREQVDALLKQCPTEQLEPLLFALRAKRDEAALSLIALGDLLGYFLPHLTDDLLPISYIYV